MLDGKVLENATTEGSSLFTSQHSPLIKNPYSMDQFSNNSLVSQLIDYNASLGTNWIQGHRVIMGT